MGHHTFADIVKPSKAILYPALAPKLGLLPSNLLLPISRFYADFEEVVRNLPSLVRGDANQRLYVVESAQRAVDEISPTLRQIEKLAGIQEAEHPKTGDAKGFIDIKRPGR